MEKHKHKGTILIVDDAPDTVEIIKRNLVTNGFRTYSASTVENALNLLDSIHFDIVITDLKLPGGSGMDLVRFIRENLKNTEVIMITGYPSINGAVEAVKTGAEEYLQKPFTDNELISAVNRAFEKLRLLKASEQKLDDSSLQFAGLIGESRKMKEIFRSIRKAASISATVLITGESGTGKELVARAIHYSSKRASAPFVPVNCGAIPETLLESELFGYVKGAFTGANETRAGFFQTADGGTIFLDEISDTSQSMQAKLLRVLQEKEVYMLGASRPRSVDIRIIAATNKDLLELVKKGVFREDLYYRLSVIVINLPPLRERDDDVILLAQFFAKKFGKEFGKGKVPKFSDRVLQVFKKYNWPGNVRELENLVQRLIAMADSDVIDITDLPLNMRFSIPRTDMINRTLEEVEMEHIKNVLTAVGNNKTQAAKILGIDRKTLREKLKKYKIDFE